jgi:hypothetical protein
LFPPASVGTNRTVNIYNATDVTNITYVNRNVATVVVPQRALASGQPIAQAQRIQLTPQVRAQLSAAPILPHPLVTPATAIVAKAPAHAVPHSGGRKSCGLLPHRSAQIGCQCAGAKQRVVDGHRVQRRAMIDDVYREHMSGAAKQCQIQQGAPPVFQR